MPRKETKELVKVEPIQALAPFEDKERWFEEAFSRRPFFFRSWLPRLRFPEPMEITPSVDIYEEGDNVMLKAEIPGIKKEEIEVHLTDDTITISGEKKKEEKVERKNYYRLERSQGSFKRTLRMPAQVQTDKASTTFKDGVLEVKIPKTDAAKRRVTKVVVR